MTRISCSHCHAMNDLFPFAPNHCSRCGHRADLPRADCDCDRCRDPNPTPVVGVEEMKEALKRIRVKADEAGLRATLDEAINMDTTNEFLVGSGGDGIVILRPPRGSITKEQALRLAAHLVAMADYSDGHAAFKDLLDAVENA